LKKLHELKAWLIPYTSTTWACTKSCLGSGWQWRLPSLPLLSFFLSFSSEEVAPFCPVLKCSCLLVIAAAAAVSLTILLLLQQQNCGQTDRPTDRLFFVHAYPLPLITAAAAPCACCMLVVREEEARSTHAEIYLHKTFILHNERTNERTTNVAWTTS